MTRRWSIVGCLCQKILDKGHLLYRYQDLSPSSEWPATGSDKEMLHVQTVFAPWTP